MDKNNFFDGRYETLVSIEHKHDSVIIEFDSTKGKRTTYLKGRLNEISSELCEAVQLIPLKEKNKYLIQPGVISA